MGGGDEVVCQWVFHVLVNPSMFRVQHTVLLRQHVHGETIGGHELVLLGCTGQKAQTQIIKVGELLYSEQTGIVIVQLVVNSIKYVTILVLSFVWSYSIKLI